MVVGKRGGIIATILSIVNLRCVFEHKPILTFKDNNTIHQNSLGVSLDDMHPMKLQTGCSTAANTYVL